MSRLPLLEAARGERVIKRSEQGELLGIYIVVDVNSKRVTVRAEDKKLPVQYSTTTGKRIGSSERIERATPQEIAAARETMEAERLERLERVEAEVRQEYESLPEGIKLARRLIGFTDSNHEEEVAEMPLELLRRFVAWIEARQCARPPVQSQESST